MAIDRDKVQTNAQKLVEKKKYDKAVAEYQKILQEDPNDARILLKVGDLQSKMLAWADAVASYERVAKLYQQQGFALKAIAVYKQIREIIAKHVPQLEERYGHVVPKLAELYQQLGLTSDALAALDEVATRLQRQQRDREATDIFRKIVELDPSNPLPHLRLAEALSRMKETDAAVVEFTLAAKQLVELGRRDDALKVIERILHHKQEPVHLRLAAELYLARGQQADGMQALAKLQICFQANPRDLDTLILLARAFEVIGQASKGIEVQKEMARLAREQGKMDLFRQTIDKLLKTAPNDEGVRRLLSPSGAPPPAAPQEPVRAPPPAARPAEARQMAPSVPEPDPDFEVEADEDLAPPSSKARGAQPAAPPKQQAFPQPPPAAPARPQPPQAAPSRPQPPQAPAAPQAAQAKPQPPAKPPVPQRQPPPAPPAQKPARPAAAEAVAKKAVLHDPRSEDYVDAEPDVVVSEPPPPSQRPEEQLAQIMADARAFLRVRLYSKAIHTLRNGIELAPRSFELRALHRDALLESGDVENAVEEMIVLANLYIDALDGESAARMLQDALAYDPRSQRAIQMLHELGYEIVDEGTEEAQTFGEDPLPAYELDEPGEEVPTRATGRALNEIDDPFAGDAPLPSFPVEHEQDSSFELVGGKAAASVEVPAPQPSGSELEDALEEADFFASRGLYDDARAILDEQLERHPNHPLLRERLTELQSQGHAAAGSGPREMPRDRAFDIAASLDALESLGGEDAAAGDGAFDGAMQQVDVEEVFAKFKEGVSKQISVDDSQSHYDLGIAYKEIGKLDDSISEFGLAARDPQRECMCRSMIGMIELERGNIDLALDAFLKGLNARVRSAEQETVLCYEIGATYETKRMNKEALQYFQRTMRRDPTYRDVQERVRRLSKNEPVAPIRQAAVGADDEFDRAFDDIIGK